MLLAIGIGMCFVGGLFLGELPWEKAVAATLLMYTGVGLIGAGLRQ